MQFKKYLGGIFDINYLRFWFLTLLQFGDNQFSMSIFTVNV